MHRVPRPHMHRFAAPNGPSFCWFAGVFAARFCVGIDGRPRPEVAPHAALLVADVLLLRTDEAPNLVALNPLATKVAHMRIVVLD